MKECSDRMIKPVVYSIADLQWRGVREGQAVATGTYSKSSNGKTKADTRYTEHIQTAGAGRIEISEWFRLMEEAIIREGQTAELEKQIKVARGLAWLYTEKQIREYALECMGNIRLSGNDSTAHHHHPGK